MNVRERCIEMKTQQQKQQKHMWKRRNKKAFFSCPTGNTRNYWGHGVGNELSFQITEKCFFPFVDVSNIKQIPLM